MDWRREWDSNPRALSRKLISSQPRYDHFDIPPYAIGGDGGAARKGSGRCKHFSLYPYGREKASLFARLIFRRLPGAKPKGALRVEPDSPIGIGMFLW